MYLSLVIKILKLMVQNCDHFCTKLIYVCLGVCMCAYMYVHILKKNSTTGLLAISKRKTHEISRSDNWNGFKNQAEKTLKLDANINNKQVKYEIKHTMLFTLASPQIKCMHASHSVRSTSLLPHELQPTRLLCQWNFPGKNPGVGSHYLLQGIDI